MIMAAPQNGWGMVGIAPTAVRVYSIRVVPPGQTTFPFTSYAFAIDRCLSVQGTTEAAMNVINLSLAGTVIPPDIDLTYLEDPIDTARNYGLNVVASAGNEGADQLDYPAAYPPVFAVGAGDSAASNLGVLCGFSNRADLDVIAPGCDTLTGGIDEAFEDDGSPAVGYGTSEAAALTSATLAAMRAYSPGLSVNEAQDCVLSTAKNGGNLDVAAAFTACGLGAVVVAGLEARPDAAASTSSSAPSPAAPPPSTASAPRVPATPTDLRLATPRLAAIRLRHHRLTITVLNRPRNARVEVKVLVKHRGHNTVVVDRTSATSKVELAIVTPATIEVRFVATGRGTEVSHWVSKPVG
jgi:hypothetical protein